LFDKQICWFGEKLELVKVLVIFVVIFYVKKIFKFSFNSIFEKRVKINEIHRLE